MLDYSLYLCTNSEMNKNYPIDYCVEQAIKGGITIVQVREKNKSFLDFVKIARKIKEVTDLYKIPLIINDNIDVVLQVDADGIHIGQGDITCVEARKILGDKKIIGVTVTNVEEAKEAIFSGANYLGVGAIYKSTTKSDASIVGVSELKKIIDCSSVPVIVIGGINKNTIPLLKGINIDGYAMIRPILGEDNIEEATKELKRIIINNKKIM